MAKKIVETPMIPLPLPKKKTKKVDPEPEHPTTGGKTPATLALISKAVDEAIASQKKEKKEPTPAQLAARERAKEKRIAKKAEEDAAVSAALEEARKKEEEIAARKAVQAEKRREKREGKKKMIAEAQLPIDKTPSIQESVTIKKEPKKMYTPPAPGEHVFDPALRPPPPSVVSREPYKAASVSNKRVGVWSVNAPTKRFR